MLAPQDRPAMLRLAASLPKGSDHRRALLKMLRQASAADDVLARADLITGALFVSGHNRSKEADADKPMYTFSGAANRDAVYTALRNGIGSYFTEVDGLLAKYSLSEPNELWELPEGDFQNDLDMSRRDFLNKKRGRWTPKMEAEMRKVPAELLDMKADYKLREAVEKGAKGGLFDRAQNIPGKTSPGAKGVAPEDLTQVYLAGGIPFPGMKFNEKESDATPYEGVILRGKFKDFTKPVFPVGTSIYTLAGAMKGMDLGAARNFSATTAKNLSIDWKRATKVPREFIDRDKALTEREDISTTVTPQKLTLESLVGAADIPGVSMSRLTQLARFYINRIDRQVTRQVKPGFPRAIWQAVVAMINKGKNPFKANKDFDIDVPAVISFLEGDREGQKILEDNGAKADKRVAQARWKKIIPVVKKTLKGLSDDELLSTVHITMDGLVDDIPEYIQEIKQDRDLYQTYLSDLRKTASERKAAMTITASERSAMIRLAAALPVGSPERRAILAGCEKLPEGPMRDNCEKKKEEGASDKKAASKVIRKVGPANVSKVTKKNGDEYFRVGWSNQSWTFDTETEALDFAKKQEKAFKAFDDAAKRSVHASRKMAGMGKLPEALKEHQFTSKDGDNPPPADADGDGKTNEPKPDFLKGKKAALVRLAATLPVGSSERKTILRMASEA